MTAPIKHYTRRAVIQFVGRFIQAALARVTITGRENIPNKGPLIVVGNHVGYAEPALMVTTMKWPIELLAGGDIPLRSKFLFLQTMYGYLTVNRGEIDRTALKSIGDILEKGGGVGIFPEGGVWDRKIGDARMGVAYISQQTQAPILPMGFGGVVGALDRALKLQRPKVTVNVGKLIPPVATSESYRERKVLAQTASNQIMSAIYDLVPPDDEINTLGVRAETFRLTVNINDAAGNALTPPAEIVTIPYSEDLSLLLNRQVLLGVLIDNMERAAAEPLRHLETERDGTKLHGAIKEALHFYAEEKPVFLGYRLGYQRADRIIQGLRALETLIGWAAAQGAQVTILPKATITYPDGRTETTDFPTNAHTVS